MVVVVVEVVVVGVLAVNGSAVCEERDDVIGAGDELETTVVVRAVVVCMDGYLEL